MTEQKEKKIVITIGVPSSGKSTIREKYLKEDPKLCVVSQDDIRFKELDSENTKIYFDPNIEPKIKTLTFDTLDKCLKSGENVFFDATNTTKDKRKPIVEQARKYGYKVEMVFIDIDPKLAILRDSKRKRQVKEKVIMDKFNEIQKPTNDEYDYFVPINPKPTKKEEKELEKMK